MNQLPEAASLNDSILMVDDDPVAIQLMGRILSGVGDLRFATSGESALQLVRESPPDLILLDAQMPGMSGFLVFDALKAEPGLADVPVIFVTSHSEAAFEVCALEMGAADFIAKPVNAPLVVARVKTHLRIKSMADELRRTASTDALTGIANRRQFDESLQREWLRNQRDGQPLSLLLIDVDHFKLYNDLYGHPKGDTCLREVAQALLGAAQRPADLVARCGGEEFMLLLPHTPRVGALHVAARVLDVVAKLQVRHEASPTARNLTVSVGIACYDAASPRWVHDPAVQRARTDPPLECTAGDLVRTVDKALYAAKAAGRAQSALLDIADVDAQLPCDATTPAPGQRKVALG
jgi:diguanylate cyclase (GGDEF)-like protein